MSRVNLAIIGGGLVGASLALALQAGAARWRCWRVSGASSALARNWG